MTAPSKLDIEKFRKVHTLMERGANEHERAAAKARAEAMAKRAGMTLKQAVSRLDAKPSAGPNVHSFNFDDIMEEKHPGWKVKEAAKNALRSMRENLRRAELLRTFGSREALLRPTERELKLTAAVEGLATWWEGDDDEDAPGHRFAVTLDGRGGNMDWISLDDITPRTKAAIEGAFPMPATLAEALAEAKYWEDLRCDRGLFLDGGAYRGEWRQSLQVIARVRIIEELLDTRPAANWDDLQARFDWKRYEFSRQWIDPTERDDPFMDRVEADVAALRSREPAHTAKPEPDTGLGTAFRRRTNADKRRDVLSILDAEPHLSDRAIGQRVGVSPTTVGKWRKLSSERRAAA